MLEIILQCDEIVPNGSMSSIPHDFFDFELGLHGETVKVIQETMSHIKQVATLVFVIDPMDTKAIKETFDGRIGWWEYVLVWMRWWNCWEWLVALICVISKEGIDNVGRW